MIHQAQKGLNTVSMSSNRLASEAPTRRGLLVIKASAIGSAMPASKPARTALRRPRTGLPMNGIVTMAMSRLETDIAASCFTSWNIR
jgi:hypothetical protein